MAILELEQGEIYTDIASINRELSSLKIAVSHWQVELPKNIASLIAKNLLSDDDKEALLQPYDEFFHQLMAEAGVISRDLLVLHPDDGYLETHLETFGSYHIHNDNEGRYIVDGECVFGFARPDDTQVKLTLQPGDYINVPINTEHWFSLTSLRRLKAIRYFTFVNEWQTTYTHRGILEAFKSVAVPA